MKKYIFPLSIAATLFAASCSSDEKIEEPLDNSMKTPIEFSMTDNTASASVGVEGSTRAGFTEKTGIVMRMKAEKFTLGGSASNAEETKYSKTYAEAEIESNGYSTVSFTNSENKINQRYWDDAYGRHTKLSIFAVAVPGKTSGISQLNLNGGESWHSETPETNTIKWTVSKSQDGTKIGEEDLVYSNNLQKDGNNGVREWDFNNSKYNDFNGDISALQNGRMKFKLKQLGSTTPDPTGPGKFDIGNLNFTHALCRVTINIDYGDEYKDTETASNAILKQMPYESVLNLTDGKFAAIEDEGYTRIDDITMHKTETTEGSKATFMGQVVPGYKINTATEDTNFLQFNIGDNTYYISQKMVYEALNVSGNKTALVYDDENKTNIIMSQGQHYILNISVTKTKIEKITATLVDWTPISGNTEKNNSYLVFDKNNDFSYQGSTPSDKFDIYRLNKRSENIITDKSYNNYEWKSGWSDESDWRTTPFHDGDKWTTTWYFEDNKSFYHFRMIGTVGSDHRSIFKDETHGDYFTIQGGDSDGNYRWGAPMAKGADFGYSLTTGFDNQGASGTKPEHNIHYAIGSTASEIPFTEFHMLSQIHVILETTSTADAVIFDSGTNKAVVKIKNAKNSGNVRMGDGLVTATEDATDISMTVPSDYWETENTKTKAYTYYAVPQALDGLVFEITTPDNNIYKIDVNKINPMSETHKGYWIPNYNYVYTLKLTKTGITNITCTLKNWEEISGSGNITIED